MVKDRVGREGQRAVSLRLDEDELQAIDALASSLGATRSMVLRAGARAIVRDPDLFTAPARRQTTAAAPKHSAEPPPPASKSRRRRKRNGR